MAEVCTLQLSLRVMDRLSGRDVHFMSISKSYGWMEMKLVMWISDVIRTRFSSGWQKYALPSISKRYGWIEMKLVMHGSSVTRTRLSAEWQKYALS